jgi:predicted DNA-binding transcriptional regulator YafY
LERFQGRRPYKALQEDGLDEERDDWLLVESEYKSFYDALMRILNYGGAAQVVSPDALRLTIQDYAEQILNVYREGE